MSTSTFRPTYLFPTNNDLDAIGGSGSSFSVAESHNVTITAGNLSVTVTHTLGSIPANVIVTELDDLAGRQTSISDRTLTTFVLNMNSIDFADHQFVCTVIK